MSWGRRPALAAAIVVTLLGAATPAATAAAAWPSPPGAGPCAVTRTTNVAVPMRDGTILRADVYRPTTTRAVPVVLMRTQYGKAPAQIQPIRYQRPDWFASHCYLVAVQDVRGQFASGGEFSEFTNDRDDGYDSVEWAAKLPGSSGKVGMYGSSYVGATQWLAAETAPPHLTTIVPANTASDYYDGWTYENGAFRLNFIEPWAMDSIALSAANHRGDTKVVQQLTQDYQNIASWLRYTPYRGFPPFHPGDRTVAPYFYDWIAHRTDGPYWQRWAPQRHYSEITIPVLDIEGWYDAFLTGGVHNFTGMVSSGGSALARTNQRIVIGPWDHIGWGRPGSVAAPMLQQIGPVGNSPVNELMLAWWDHFLKGIDNGVSTGPTLNYFEMGANVWKTASAWPLPGTHWMNYYLSSGGHASSLLGDGQLVTTAPASGQQPDTYDYDPRNPVPSVGGHSCCAAPGGSQGPYDQRAVERRGDVLVYTTAPLTADTEVTGPISVTLYASSSAPDTDWTAKLVDVHPDGTAVNLNNGIQRASFRESSSAPTLIEPGTVYQYTITVWPTSNLFRVGHRIRLEISSSDFPQFDPNPNTGSWLGESTATQVAHQSVLHDPEHPSALVLPVIPTSASGQPSTTFPITTRH
ncbi:MAG: CocE/NonD family hydrolase [Pseudonocardiales bacterium]|nr:CocE/NonD family hydrolase [Pseudonocardiales bacterium]